AGEEWEHDRRDLVPPQEALSELVREALVNLMGRPERPRLQGRSFPWAATYSDGRRFDDVALVDPRDDAPVRVDLRFLPLPAERADAAWIRRSAETTLRDRLVWVCGAPETAEEQCRELYRSRQMVLRYEPRRESLNIARQQLLLSE